MNTLFKPPDAFNKSNWSKSKNKCKFCKLYVIWLPVEMSAQTQMHCSSVHCCSVWRSPQQLTAPHSSLSSQHKNMQQANQKSFKGAPCQYSVTLTWRWRRLGWQNEQEAPGSFTSPSDDGSVSTILTYHHEPFKIWTFCREHDWLAIYTQTNAGFTLVDILFVILKESAIFPTQVRMWSLETDSGVETNFA